jgi:hypothetical protein
MKKRSFLSLGVGAGVLATTAATQAAPAPARSPALLTLSGAVRKSNRGAVDAALDQLMVKHGVQFSAAFTFDAAALARLPAVTIKPTLEYDAKVHTLSGPLLTTVLDAAGAPADGATKVRLRAIDGYNVVLTRSDAQAYRMIVATQVDGRPLALGGLGPQWAVYEADTVAAFKDKPLKERFGLCPWGLYHVEVLGA